ncbi:MAG: hypothetical protein ACO1O3_10845 [Sphingobium sp.]
MDHFDQSYFRRRADEERARAREQQGTTAAIFYHKLADAYERQATSGSHIPNAGAHASSQHA